MFERWRVQGWGMISFANQDLAERAFAGETRIIAGRYAGHISQTIPDRVVLRDGGNSGEAELFFSDSISQSSI